MKLGDLRWNGDDDGQDLLLDVVPISVYALIRGRNAWNSTWVRHWFHNSHLFTNLNDAKLGAEDLRQRGNVFYINQVPGIWLHGSRTDIAIIDGIAGTPFANFEGMTQELERTYDGFAHRGVYPGVTMREAAIEFGPGSRAWSDRAAGPHNNSRSGATAHPTKFTPLPVGGYHAFTSVPVGSDRYLNWEPRRTEVDPTAVHQVVAAWRRMTSVALRHQEAVIDGHLVIDGAARARAQTAFTSQRERLAQEAGGVQDFYQSALKECATSLNDQRDKISRTRAEIARVEGTLKRAKQQRLAVEAQANRMNRLTLQVEHELDEARTAEAVSAGRLDRLETALAEQNMEINRLHAHFEEISRLLNRRHYTSL